MPDKSIAEHLKASQFVVAGSVESVGSTTMPIDPTVPNVGVFKVDEILRGPQALMGFAGREITVAFQESRGVRAGERLVLFTTSWLYGQSLAVLETGRMEDRDRTAMRKEIEEAQESLEDEKLRERINRAQLVVAGEVEKTAPLEKSGHRFPITEHDPVWWTAVIEVETFLKSRGERRVTILFPASLDIAWSQSPKCERGQKGIWILQRDQQERGWPAMRVPGLTALDPLDFQPMSEMARVRRLTRKA